MSKAKAKVKSSKLSKQSKKLTQLMRDLSKAKVGGASHAPSTCIRVYCIAY